MARRPFMWICHCCNENQRGKEGDMICLPCSKDASRLRGIYTEIVLRFPVFSQMNMAEVFARLWRRFKKSHPVGKKPPRIVKHDPRFFPCTLPADSCIGLVKELLCEDIL